MPDQSRQASQAVDEGLFFLQPIQLYKKSDLVKVVVVMLELVKFSLTDVTIYRFFVHPTIVPNEEAAEVPPSAKKRKGRPPGSGKKSGMPNGDVEKRRPPGPTTVSSNPVHFTDFEQFKNWET
jgi:hypothetical protein